MKKMSAIEFLFLAYVNLVTFSAGFSEWANCNSPSLTLTEVESRKILNRNLA